jgi:hypothetical protein
MRLAVALDLLACARGAQGSSANCNPPPTGGWNVASAGSTGREQVNAIFSSFALAPPAPMTGQQPDPSAGNIGIAIDGASETSGISATFTPTGTPLWAINGSLNQTTVVDTNISLDSSLNPPGGTWAITSLSLAAIDPMASNVSGVNDPNSTMTVFVGFCLGASTFSPECAHQGEIELSETGTTSGPREIAR